MYAIVAGFDYQTEKRVRELWQGLAENRISDYAAQVVDRKPHITLASFDEIRNFKDFQENLKIWVNKRPAVSFQIGSVGFFFGLGALYLAPLVTRKLLDFHADLHKAISPFVTLRHQSLYVPEVWLPHVTLANYLTDSQLSQALFYCKANETAFKGLSLIHI